jgi:hypothetical protein
MRSLSLLSVLVLAIACDGGKAPLIYTDDDAGTDGGDLGDGGTTDGGTSDGGEVDGGGVDSGTPSDGGMPDSGNPTDGGAAPVTTANPHGETHTGALSVTLTSVPASTIKYTTDGSDPTTSATATSGASPLVVTLEAPAVISLRFFALGTTGPNEVPHAETYTLVENLNPASISGRLFLPDALHTGSAAALLYRVDPRTNSGAMPVALQTLSPQAGGSPYHFDGLAAGRYWVTGAWWSNATPSGDPSAFGIARLSPSSVDPSVVANSRVDFVDVYVGECDPLDSGVDGVVTLSSDLVSDEVIVAAYANTPTPATIQGNPAGYALAIGSGTTRPFAMCGTAPGNVYVMAGAGMSMTRPGTNAGLYQGYAGNPVNVTHVSHINFRLGDQDASLGSISGTIHLNGGLIGGVLNVAATTGSGLITQQAIQELQGIDGTTDKDYAYSLNNLPAGTYTVTLGLKSADALNAYSQAPQPVTISLPANANITQDLNGSVGRVSGTVTVTNPGASGANVAVVVTVPSGNHDPAATATMTLGAAAGNGSRSASYVAFGIPDGTFNLGAIVDTNNNGNYLDDLQNSCLGVAPQILISVTLPGTRCP